MGGDASRENQEAQQQAANRFTLGQQDQHLVGLSGGLPKQQAPNQLAGEGADTTNVLKDLQQDDLDEIQRQ